MNAEKIGRELIKLAKSLIAGELIKFNKFIVTKDEILVSSSGTTYADFKRRKFPKNGIDDLLVKMKQIKTTAKKKNVKLRNFNKTLLKLKKSNSEYNSKIAEYNKLFDNLYKLWKKIEKKKDLFYIPTSDLDKRIPEYGMSIKIGNKISKMFWGGEILSNISSIRNNIDDALELLQEDNVTMVGL